MPALRPGGDARTRNRLQRRHAEALGCPLQGPRERLRVRVLEPAARLEVRVVDDDVGVRDTSCVVVVVDDGDLVVREALPCPSGREGAQSVERDAVLGIRGDDVVLVGAGAPPSPSGVVAVQAPGPVHRLGPVERPPRRRRFEVDVILGERAALLRQVPPDPPGRGVPRYRLEHGHAPHLHSPAMTLPESSATARLSDSTPGCISASLRSARESSSTTSEVSMSFALR